MKQTILIADDNELNREILSSILEGSYHILTASGGEEAISIIDAEQEDLSGVLLDLVMPETDGFEVLNFMNDCDLISRIPVLIISGETDSKIEDKCFAMGVSDYIRKPFVNNIVNRRVKNVVDLFDYQKNLESLVRKQTHTLRKQNTMLEQQSRELRRSKERLTDILGNVVEYRNNESGEHVQRVKAFTNVLANHMMKLYPEYNLTAEEIAIITSASSLHDVGKIAISDNILLKPGRLTNEEFEQMKEHTVIGEEMLSEIEGVWDEHYKTVCCQIARYHHERNDGRGYPDGLRGDEIPLAAQLVSVADVYDALVNKRCYKEAYPKDEAYEMILNGKCGEFSPKLMECFKASRAEFERLAEGSISLSELEAAVE